MQITSDHTIQRRRTQILLPPCFQGNMILDSSVLTTCAQSIAWESALAILDCEEPHLGSWGVGFAKDVVAFASTITACEKASQWEWAIHLLRHAGKKLQLNAIIYSAAISALAEGLLPRRQRNRSEGMQKLDILRRM